MNDLSFDLLNDNLVLEVFSSLETYADIHSFSRTSKRMHGLSKKFDGVLAIKSKMLSRYNWLDQFNDEFLKHLQNKLEKTNSFHPKLSLGQLFVITLLAYFFLDAKSRLLLLSFSFMCAALLGRESFIQNKKTQRYDHLIKDLNLLVPRYVEAKTGAIYQEKWGDSRAPVIEELIEAKSYIAEFKQAIKRSNKVEIKFQECAKNPSFWKELTPEKAKELALKDSIEDSDDFMAVDALYRYHCYYN